MSQAPFKKEKTDTQKEPPPCTTNQTKPPNSTATENLTCPVQCTRVCPWHSCSMRGSSAPVTHPARQAFACLGQAAVGSSHTWWSAHWAPPQAQGYSLGTSSDAAAVLPQLGIERMTKRLAALSIFHWATKDSSCNPPHLLSKGLPGTLPL